MSFFSIQKQDSKSKARAGIIHTEHGDLQTPVLMIVGTKASVKTLSTHQLEEIGVPVVLCNTYHLHINPGEDIVQNAGGLHGFMDYQKPMFTDSGGFQVFSMGKGMNANEIKGKNVRHSKQSMLKITEEGAKFKSYKNGDLIMLSPEKSMEIQWKLGADMIAAFDECTPFHVSYEYTKRSMERTHRWLDRCQKKLKDLKSTQSLYGIIQGGIYQNLREESTDYIVKADTPGICIGGTLGENKDDLYEVTDFLMQRIPREKPIHLLGIGYIDDLVRGVSIGIDTFDCVTPTRNARHGLLYDYANPRDSINLLRSKYANDHSPLDDTGTCAFSARYTKAYVHYLLKAKEMLGYQICTYHNVSFVTKLMKAVRLSIMEDRFQEFQDQYWNDNNVDFSVL